MIKRITLSVILVVILLALFPISVLASPSLSVSLVGGKGLNPEVIAGEQYIQTFKISVDGGADILIEVLGYGTDISGNIKILEPFADNNSYSARTFITPQSQIVHAGAGQDIRVSVNVSIPQLVGSGGRYAIFRISAVVSISDDGIVKTSSAMVLPIKFTIRNSNLNKQGIIKELNVSGSLDNGNINVITLFQNIGNIHYKANIIIGIYDGEKVINEVKTPSVSFVLPFAIREIKSQVSSQELQFNTQYKLKVIASLDDGTVLAETVKLISVDDSGIITTDNVGSCWVLILIIVNGFISLSFLAWRMSKKR
jgi:hypothetical protein